MLQLGKDANYRGSGQEVSEAVDLLLKVPSLVLVGISGCSRARKVNKRLELLMASHLDELTHEEDTEPKRQGSQAPPRDEEATNRTAAKRASKQLALSSVPTDMYRVGTGDEGGAPEAQPQAPPATSPPPVQVTADVLREVLQSKLTGGPQWGNQGPPVSN